MRWVVLFCVFMLVTTGDAHGYLDPGSGSAILQGIIGALAAIAITLKLYWHRLMRLLGLRKSSPSEDADYDDDDDDDDESTDKPTP